MLTPTRCCLCCCAPLRRFETPQSFEFLVDVADFKTFDRGDDGGVGNEISLDFAKFLGIVSTYIKYDSHLEINIGENLKRDIMDYTKFEAYLLLGPVSWHEKLFGFEWCNWLGVALPPLFLFVVTLISSKSGSEKSAPPR